MEVSEYIKEFFMLGINFGPNHKCMLGGIILVKWGVRLTSVQFIGSLNLKIKNREPNQIRSI